MTKSPHSTGNANQVFRLVAFLMLITSGIALFVWADFDLTNLLQKVQQTSPLQFVSLMVVLPLVGFPISAFYLYAGSAFPWWEATLLCSLSLAINISAAYPLAKYLLKSPVNHFMAKYSKELPSLTEVTQFRVTFLVRSIPGIPYFMQNYMLPLLGVKFVHYFLISWSIQSVFAAGMASLPHLVKQSGWATAGIVGGLVVLLILFRRIYLKKKAIEEG